MSRNEKTSKCLSVMAAVVVCLVCGPAQAGAGTWQQGQKLLASDGAANDWFGITISMSGDYAIVGAYYDDDKGIESGSAYIFKWNGTGWSQQQKLLASDGAAGDNFGMSVSISGDYAIIGASVDDNYKGAAYIFRWDGASWSEQQKLLASDGAADDGFGWSVSIDGDRAVVGAYGDDLYKGSSYIFKRDGTSWVQQQKLVASDGAAFDEFGTNVSVSGDYAIVGAYGNNNYKGSAYVFKWDGVSWAEQQKLVASDGAMGDYFGKSVSISGDYAILGAHYDDSAKGSAYVFKRDGTSWSEQQKLIALDGAGGDAFGMSVCINGDHAIVGACYDDDMGTSSGSTYVFKRNGTSWSEQQKLTASDGAANDYFGYSVSISGDYASGYRAGVGADRDGDNGINSGSAYMFRFCPAADLSDDCKVDIVDFAVFTNWWLQSPGAASADIAPLPDGDGIVNFLDFAVFADWWLYGIE
jgi:hypothetical protein